MNYPSKVLHQLLQRASSAALHRTGPEAAAGGVPEGGHQVGSHRLLQQPGAFSLFMGLSFVRLGITCPLLGYQAPLKGPQFRLVIVAVEATR